MKCRMCVNYFEKLDTCKYCHFEYDESYKSDDWDILNLNDEDGWTHHQIRDRLFAKGVECLKVDIWTDNNVAYLIGCNGKDDALARILNVHEEVIYNDYEQGWIIINLFQEKYLRGLLDE